MTARAAAFATLCVFAFIGCTPTSAPEPTPAPEATPVADARAGMRGEWTIDADRLASQPQFAEMTPEQRTLALEMASNMLASMTVRFDESKYEITTGGKTVSGTYTVVEEGSGKVVLELVEAEGQPERVTLTVDSLGLIMRADGDDALPLKRKAPAE